MQQVKLFKGIESEVKAMEDEINAWIRKSRAQVISITGNISPQSRRSESDANALGTGGFAPSDVLLVVLYETPVA